MEAADTRQAILEKPIKRDITRIARALGRGWAIKFFTARIAQRVANTCCVVTSGRGLERSATVAAEVKRLNAH
ncbi:TPA: hypothetical protein L4R50_000377 [Pseudomonas aeruginosa]|nr:hypothetical protein [Pseudomonas aeruginosa]